MELAAPRPAAVVILLLCHASSSSPAYESSTAPSRAMTSGLPSATTGTAMTSLPSNGSVPTTGSPASTYTSGAPTQPLLRSGGTPSPAASTATGADEEPDALEAEEESPEDVSDESAGLLRGWVSLPPMTRNHKSCNGLRCMEAVWPHKPVCAVWQGDFFIFNNLCDMQDFNCMAEREYVPVTMEECSQDFVTSFPTRPHSTSVPTSPPTTTTTLHPTTTTSPPTTSSTTPSTTITTTPSTTTLSTTTPTTTTSSPTTPSTTTPIPTTPSTTTTMLPSRTTVRRSTFPTFPIHPAYPALDPAFNVTLSHPLPSIPTLPTMNMFRLQNRRNGSCPYCTQSLFNLTLNSTSESPLTVPSENASVT